MIMIISISLIGCTSYIDILFKTQITITTIIHLTTTIMYECLIDKLLIFNIIYYLLFVWVFYQLS